MLETKVLIEFGPRLRPAAFHGTGGLDVLCLSGCFSKPQHVLLRGCRDGACPTRYGALLKQPDKHKTSRPPTILRRGIVGGPQSASAIARSLKS